MHDAELKSFDFKPLLADDSKRTEWLARFPELPSVPLDERALLDLDFLAVGAYSPLSGFMGQDDYESSLETMRLADETPWPIPITLPVGPEIAEGLTIGETIGLTDTAGRALAVLHLREIFDYNKEREAELVFTTKERGHSGVAELYERGEWCLAGSVEALERPALPGIALRERTPTGVRASALKLNWVRVAGIVTEALPHRALEYYMQSALETMDGLHLQILGGAPDQAPPDVRLAAHDALLRGYFPTNSILAGYHPARLRYAGPREAVLHAVMERNYGCTDIIITRDYAGTGNFYGTYDSFDIFEDFENGELGILPILQENAFYSRKIQSMATHRTAPPAAEDERITLSDRELHETLQAGTPPPPEIMRGDIAEILLGRSGDGAADHGDKGNEE